MNPHLLSALLLIVIAGGCDAVSPFQAFRRPFNAGDPAPTDPVTDPEATRFQLSDLDSPESPLALEGMLDAGPADPALSPTSGTTPAAYTESATLQLEAAVDAVSEPAPGADAPMAAIAEPPTTAGDAATAASPSSSDAIPPDAHQATDVATAAGASSESAAPAATTATPEDSASAENTTAPESDAAPADATTETASTGGSDSENAAPESAIASTAIASEMRGPLDDATESGGPERTVSLASLEFDQPPSSETAPLLNPFAALARRTISALGLAKAEAPGVSREKLAQQIHEFQRFPFAFELPNVAGELVHSDRFRGQLMVVDVWATWCGPCRQAIPDFVAIQEDYESLGVQVVGITCDSDDPADAADTARKAFNVGKNLNVNYPLLVDDGTTIDQIPGFRGYPTTLFMTPDGQVRYMVTGVQSKERLAAMIETILQL